MSHGEAKFTCEVNFPDEDDIMRRKHLEEDKKGAYRKKFAIEKEKSIREMLNDETKRKEFF